MKNTPLILILALFANCNLCFSQTITTNYEDEDIKSAFELMGINLYKFNFDGMKEDTYITVTVDEYIPDSIINSKTYSFDPSRVKENQTNEIKVFSKRERYDSETLWLNLIYPTNHILDRFDLLEEYRDSHFWREFRQGELEYDKKIPILLCGTAWSVKYPSGVEIMKFCPQYLERDLSNEEFTKMPHYFIISYELKSK